MTVDENLFLLFQRSSQRIGKYLHWIHSAHCKFISFVVYDQRLTHFWFICFLCCFLAFAPFCSLMAGEWELGFVRSPFRVFKLNSPEANNQLDRNYFKPALGGHRRGSTRCGRLVGSGCGICLACALQTQWISPIFISTRHGERFVKFCNSHRERRKKS